MVDVGGRGGDRHKTQSLQDRPAVVGGVDLEQRIVRYASVVGREHVMAGVDCGFGTFAGRVQVDTNIVWHKLRSLVEGADLASKELW